MDRFRFIVSYFSRDKLVELFCTSLNLNNGFVHLSNQGSSSRKKIHVEEVARSSLKCSLKFEIVTMVIHWCWVLGVGCWTVWINTLCIMHRS